MYITISGLPGEGKTTELLRLCSAHLNEGKKVIFITTQEDYDGYIADLEKWETKNIKTHFRPVYAKDMEAAMQIAPYVDSGVYNLIALDGYGLVSIKDYNNLMKLTNDRGVIAATVSKNM